jgi:hypothetical protein
VRPPGSSLALSSAISLSHPKKHSTIAQTHVLADLAAMKVHQFFTANSCAGGLVYRMLFIDGDEREVSLPQPSLFSIRGMSWSCSKEELDEQLRLLGFHGQHQEEEAATDDYVVHYTGASSSSYLLGG